MASDTADTAYEQVRHVRSQQRADPQVLHQLRAAAMTTTVAATWATTEEVAAFTGYKVPTLKGWRSRGGGPPYEKQGRGVRYWLPDVHDWMKQRRTRTT